MEDIQESYGITRMSFSEVFSNGYCDMKSARAFGVIRNRLKSVDIVSWSFPDTVKYG